MAREIEIAAVALTALAEHGIPPDIQELLIVGDPRQGIPPGAITKVVRAVLAVANGESK